MLNIFYMNFLRLTASVPDVPDVPYFEKVLKSKI